MLLFTLQSIARTAFATCAPKVSRPVVPECVCSRRYNIRSFDLTALQHAILDLAMHFLLFYDVVDDYVNRRAHYRTEHLSLIQEAYDRGELVMAGALADPPDGAVLVFRGSPAPAESFAQADPYVRNGLVKNWRVRKWNTVVGDGAQMPPQTAQ